MPANGRTLRRSLEHDLHAADEPAPSVVAPTPVVESLRVRHLSSHVVLEFYGPTGVDVHFLDRVGARQLAHGILAASDTLAIANAPAKF